MGGFTTLTIILKLHLFMQIKTPCNWWESILMTKSCKTIFDLGRRFKYIKKYLKSKKKIKKNH